MVRIVFGSDLGRAGSMEVEARTLGEALASVDELPDDVRVFVDGVDASRLEEASTPVGDEDTVLVTTW